MAKFEEVFSVVSSVTNLTFTTTTDPNADFKIVIDDDEVLGDFDGQMGPPGEANAGIGIFDGQNIDRGPGGPMEAGGYDFMVVTHEFMHALGLAHPHDTGGSSSIMNGVGDAYDDYGDYDLNQGTFTVMTYNNGYFTGSPGSQPDANHIYGYEAGPMALDIAILQSLYGANMTTATGDNTYLLPDENAPGTSWQAIWDAGGTDTIAYAGTRNATIDLRAATLLYEPGGGGWVSAADGISGGFTIANGVEIENATGGSGNDSLVGNAIANTLIGGAGNDSLHGNEGDDTLGGGEGADELSGGEGADQLSGDAGNDSLYGDAGD
ncbi:MAG: M10 family metallopeptidase C-terminal domain-containing protein, partial [Paracoccaceae bacterium]